MDEFKYGKKSLELCCYVIGGGAFSVFLRWLQNQLAFNELGLPEKSSLHVFLVLFFVVQQIEANFIYPRVVGKHVGLPGLWPLIGVTLGVALFGFVGAFVGVPLTATIFRIVESDISRREQLHEEGPTPFEKLHKSLSD